MPFPAIFCGSPRFYIPSRRFLWLPAIFWRPPPFQIRSRWFHASSHHLLGLPSVSKSVVTVLHFFPPFFVASHRFKVDRDGFTPLPAGIWGFVSSRYLAVPFFGGS